MIFIISTQHFTVCYSNSGSVLPSLSLSCLFTLTALSPGGGAGSHPSPATPAPTPLCTQQQELAAASFCIPLVPFPCRPEGSEPCPQHRNKPCVPPGQVIAGMGSWDTFHVHWDCWLPQNKAGLPQGRGAWTVLARMGILKLSAKIQDYQDLSEGGTNRKTFSFAFLLFGEIFWGWFFCVSPRGYDVF